MLARTEPTGDFSQFFPADDPIRQELESLFPPYPGPRRPRNRLAGGYPLAGNIRR